LRFGILRRWIKREKEIARKEKARKEKDLWCLQIESCRWQSASSTAVMASLAVARLDQTELNWLRMVAKVWKMNGKNEEVNVGSVSEDICLGR